MSPPNRVIIALTSNNDVFYEDGKRSGVFWSEAAHPFHVFTKAGFEVDFVSETGKFGVDEHSLDVSIGFISPEDLKEYNDSTSELQKAIHKVQKAEDVDASKYGIFFAAGGHAALIDFPSATKTQAIAEKIYESGGVIAAVCHGPAILENIRDLKTGKFLVDGKKVTGFTDVGEEELQLDHAIKKKKLKTLEEIYPTLGATYVEPVGPFATFSVVDGRLVTGVNPQSATDTAEKTLGVYNKLS